MYDPSRLLSRPDFAAVAARLCELAAQPPLFVPRPPPPPPREDDGDGSGPSTDDGWGFGEVGAAVPPCLGAFEPRDDGEEGGGGIWVVVGGCNPGLRAAFLRSQRSEA